MLFVRDFVNPDLAQIPAARSWRDIPQPVSPRGMSPSGRWRRMGGVARQIALGALVVALAWGGWFVVASLRESSPDMPAAAKSVAIKPPELRTTHDGVLDSAWLARTLALPARVSLMDLDLEKLRARLLEDNQVLTATLSRQFPDRLIAQVTERAPVARIRVQRAGVARDWLVARDGFVFAGSGFDPAMLESLPWLAGIALTTEGGRVQAIPRMATVAQLLADAQFAAQHLYRSWQIVSLARLDSDNEIEVTTRDNVTIVFGAKGAFMQQLANLDFMMEKLARQPSARVRIDLSLGREVPVRIEPLTEADRPSKAIAVSFSPRPLSNQREL